MSNSSARSTAAPAVARGDQLVVIGIALDDGADHHDAVDILALEQFLDGQRHVENAGYVDDAADFRTEEFEVAARPLSHE